MSTATTPGELPVRAYARLLLRLHNLIAKGEGDSIEADGIRDEMDEWWLAMTGQEQARARGLSRDLYTLVEGDVQGVVMSPAERGQWSRDVRAALEAWRLGDPDALLEFLRRPHPEGLPAHAVRFLQARCWEGLGDLETALQFMRDAARLDPDMAVCVLILLDKLARSEEARNYAQHILADGRSSPDGLYLASAVLLLPTRSMTGTQAKPTLDSLVPTLERALADERATPVERRETPELEPLIAFTLGLCHERLGNDSRAIEVYTDSLVRDPGNAELLCARGIARYETDRAAALQDFERARRAGALSVWPYYILAHHALEQENYLRCWRLCLEGLECEARDPVRAQLHEWLGICQVMLGQSRAVVRETFGEAERLDPGNEGIRCSRQLAEERMSATARQTMPWRSAEASIGKVRTLRRADVDRMQERFDELRNGSVTRQLAPA